MENKLIEASSKEGRGQFILGDSAFWIQDIYRILNELDARIIKLENK